MTWLIILVLIVAIGVWAFYKVPAVNKFFRDSETVALQTVKAFLGLVASGFALVDQSQLQDATQTVVTNLGLARWWPVYALGFGLFMIAVNRFRQKA